MFETLEMLSRDSSLEIVLDIVQLMNFQDP